MIFQWLLLLGAVLGYFTVSNAQPTSADCQGAIPVCQLIYDVPTLVLETDNVKNEINPNISCLSAGELNGVWYTFTVQTAGDLNFNIIPNNASDDYDWVVYNLTNSSCSDIRSDPSLQVSCNFSGASANNGITGANGGNGPLDEPVIPVQAGQTFMLYISNYSSTSSGYRLDFTNSTAQIPDNVPPRLVNAAPDLPCGATRVRVTFSENVLCSSVSGSDFSFTGPGGPYSVISVTSADCAIGARYSDNFELVISPTISTTGTFQLNLVGTIDDVCGNVASATNTPPVVFNYDALVLSTASVDADCGVNNGVASVSVTGGSPPYTYLWNDPAAQTTDTATGLARGTYQVTVRDSKGCTSIRSVYVGDPTSFTFDIIQAADTCSKGSGQILVNVTGTTAPYLYSIDYGPNLGNPGFSNLTGDTAYVIRVTDNLGCFLDTTFVMNNSFNDSLRAFFSVSDQSVNFLFPYVSFYNESDFETSVIWLLDNQFFTQNQFQYEFPNIGEYPVILTAIDQNGCRDSISMIIEVYYEFAIYIPDAFTVNEDGLNETFQIKGVGIDPNNFELKIYDRWGQVVFMTQDLNQPWDGRVNNQKPLEAQYGAYAYKIILKELNGRPHEFEGRVIMFK